MAVSPVLENESVNSFVWALIQKSRKSPNVGCRQLADVNGAVQRADKIRSGLVTSRRVLVMSLSGQITWEHPLADVVGTQTSIELKDYLSIGVRPVGSGNRAVPPKWEKINCGSSASRDVLNSSLKKALANFGLTSARQRAAMYGPNTDFVATPGMSPKSIEMVDLSGADNDDFIHHLKVFSANVHTIPQRSVCSVRIIIVNRLEFELKPVNSTMESGV